MLETKIVDIDQVYPDENNPRDDFGDLEALAATFELNVDRPGEPINPPILVQDGDIYRIVDGERRYRAMLTTGIMGFTAIVCDTYADANALIAMMATDDKKTLTEIEKSRGVQQMLLLGIDPDTAAKAARVEALDMYKVKRSLAFKDDPGEYKMTLERLYAMGEDWLDDEAIKAIEGAKEENWRWVYECEKRRVGYVKFRAAVERLVEEENDDDFDDHLEFKTTGLGYPPDVDNKLGAKKDGRVSYDDWLEDEKSLFNMLLQDPESEIPSYKSDLMFIMYYAGDPKSQWDQAKAFLYVKHEPTEDDDDDDDSIEEQEQRGRHIDAWSRDGNRREKFLKKYVNKIQKNDQYTALDKWCMSKCFDSYSLVSSSYYSTILRADCIDDSIATYATILDAFTAEGYELSPEETELRDIIRALPEEPAKDEEGD